MEEGKDQAFRWRPGSGIENKGLWHSLVSHPFSGEPHPRHPKSLPRGEYSSATFTHLLLPSLRALGCLPLFGASPQGQSGLGTPIAYPLGSRLHPNRNSLFLHGATCRGLFSPGTLPAYTPLAQDLRLAPGTAPALPPNSPGVAGTWPLAQDLRRTGDRHADSAPMQAAGQASRPTIPGTWPR